MTSSRRETLQRFYAAEAAYMAADRPEFGPVAATLHPECLIREPETLPYGGEWRGHDGFERWMRAFRDTWSALSVEDAEVFEAGDHLFSRSQVRATARVTGHETDWVLLQQVGFRDGLILSLEPFHWDTAAILPALGPSREGGAWRR